MPDAGTSATGASFRAMDEQQRTQALRDPAVAAPPPGAADTPRQYTLGQVLGVWALAALPMAVLAWVVTPVLAGWLSGPAAGARALLACMAVGMVWQFAVVLGLLRREIGPLRWPAVREALWLRAPRSPRTGRSGGRVWWVLVPAVLVVGIAQLLPGLPVPAGRDLGHLLRSPAGQEFLSGNWRWFAVIVVMAVFNTVLGEELLFRGLLLPRMRGVFGRGDWVANGVLFAAYHVHMPWAIPKVLLDTLALAYPSRRYTSAWLGIIVHSLQSVLIVGASLALVLR